MAANRTRTNGRWFTASLLITTVAVVARAEDAGKGIYRLSADGQLQLVVPMGNLAMTSPQQSPDGKYIAYDATASFNDAGQPSPELDHVFVVPTEGGEPRDLGPGMLPAGRRTASRSASLSPRRARARRLCM